MSSVSFHSAVVIIPPTDLWSQIQDIRKDYDKAFETWMPHINLLFPFVENDHQGRNFKVAADKIRSSLAVKGHQRFTVRFSEKSFGYFEHNTSRSCTVHLKPIIVEKTSSSQQNHQKTDTRKRTSRWDPPSEAKIAHTQARKVTFQASPPPPPIPTTLTKASFRIVQIAPVSPIPDEFRNLPPPSLSSLKDAVWDNYNTHPAVTDRPTVGLDCLQYAVWTPEDFQLSKSPRKVSSEVIYEVMDSSQVSLDDSPMPNKPKELPSLSGDNRIEILKPKEPPNGNSLLRLQSDLEGIYPEFNHQCRKSSAGYQPHLTLGQCAKADVEKFIAKLKTSWKTIEFSVDKIHLISRRGREMHRVYQTVNFTE